jgi:hypothetical protein
MKYKMLMILIMAVMMLFLRVPPEASAETPIFSDSEIVHATAVHEQHLRELMDLPGVHGVGIGEKSGHIGILILVDDESRMPYMPKTVEDMSAIIRAVGEITAHQINLGVDGGNNIVCDGYCASGTVGFKVCDNTTSGVGGFITNNHVAATGCPGLCPNKAPLGTNFFSPSFCDGGTTNVGTLSRFIPIVLDDATLNYVDAAFVQSTDAQVSNNIQGIGPQNNSVVTAYLGQAVCKSGRTSGLTCGTVRGINLTISVNYSDDGHCGTAILSNQVMYSPTSPYTVMSQPGDSGSPVVEANTNAAVALNFAGDISGDGFGNPIGVVLSALNVSLCGNILPGPVECNLVPDATVIPRRGTLGIQATVTNNTDEVQVFKFATRITKPNGGKAPPNGYLKGPVWVRLATHDSGSGHISHFIPSTAPLGTYTYHGYVGVLGNIYDECQFNFTVTE